MLLYFVLYSWAKRKLIRLHTVDRSKQQAYFCFHETIQDAHANFSEYSKFLHDEDSFELFDSSCRSNESEVSKVLERSVTDSFKFNRKRLFSKIY